MSRNVPVKLWEKVCPLKHFFQGKSFFDKRKLESFLKSFEDVSSYFAPRRYFKCFVNSSLGTLSQKSKGIFLAKKNYQVEKHSIKVHIFQKRICCHFGKFCSYFESNSLLIVRSCNESNGLFSARWFILTR